MRVGVIMGSTSDWDVMKAACDMLDEFGIAYEKKVVSAHRTPKLLYDYAEEAKQRQIEVIIAGAGGAAHLPGMVASMTSLPVIGVPIKTKSLDGIDSLLSIAQMPPGIPVASMAINGAKNAALFAVRILAIKDIDIAEKLDKFMANQTQNVLHNSELK